ncbi:DNA excision repair protein [Ascosphaera apis ARSEF 7405]|uniref:DNA excision repair protein n=1 Tax=Ascosphaera apis ARSEF 7405 TaxID=392613 RepID=A0A167WNX9_9EURO|nr:DNA excision repair protein [Ascosphaera apis ARSEF 7405]
MDGDWEIQASDDLTVDDGSDSARPHPDTEGLTHLLRNQREISSPNRKRCKASTVGESKIPITIDDDSTASEETDALLTDGEQVYKDFKNRKSIARKRAALEAQRSRQRAASRRHKRKAGVDGIVGRHDEPSRELKKPKWWKEFGDPSSDEERAEKLPAYLKQRSLLLPKIAGNDLQRLSTRDALVRAGLRLPPSYEDIDFSDEEDEDHSMPEKPAFTDTKPCRRYEDILLPASLGIIPASIAQWLRDYQVEGVSFLHRQFVYQKGCILGDDMGLGKTVQVIAFLTAAYGKSGNMLDAKRMRKIRRLGEEVWYPRTLIICPGSLLKNWQSELDRWGWWHHDCFHGPDKESAFQAALSGRTEILLTTYKTYVLNKSTLNMIEWDCVIADECHIIKERRSETSMAMNEVNAFCRIGLTGTAVQNKYEELWTLLNWANTGRFCSYSDWKRLVCEPLRVGQSHDATVNELKLARRIARELVNNLLPQFFLRRLKTLIADQLPKKLDRVVFCPLTPKQADAYENLLDTDVIQTIVNSTDICPCGSGKKQGWCCGSIVPDRGRWQTYVFPSMMNLQKLSNHLALLIPQSKEPREKQDRDIETLQAAVPDAWKQLFQSRDSIIHYANPEYCGKWKVLRKLLSWWHANGDKVLVFSHSVRLLKMLRMLFQHTSYNVSYLDGEMTYSDRAKAVDEFNNDPGQFVFLISTRAGGVGLNITSANKVVVVDPNWNPSYDLQAQDRAYRIGQRRDVEVFRLVSSGTIEEIVYARQIYKQQQANIAYNASEERRYFQGVQQRKDKKGEIFGLKNLFQYQNDNVVLRDIVNRTNVAESKAGVRIAELEIDDDISSRDGAEEGHTPEQAAMNQLAAALVQGDDIDEKMAMFKKSNPSVDPIQAILSKAGVQYTHENSEVIGTSKVEKHLSRQAQLGNANTDEGNRQIFDGDKSMDTVFGADSRFRYHPPQDVMNRQFCSMSKHFGYASVTEFALAIEGMTQKERRACLDRWYFDRRKVIDKKEPSSASSNSHQTSGTMDEPIILT